MARAAARNAARAWGLDGEGRTGSAPDPYGDRPARGRAPWSERGDWAADPASPSGTSPAWWDEAPSSRLARPGGPSYPATISDSSRLWAAAAPLGIIAGAIFSAGLLSFVIPLLVWQLRKGTDPFAAEHGREAMNAMMSLLVYGLVAAVVVIPVTIVTVGIGLLAMLFAAGVVGLVFVVSLVVATIRALNSQPFRYPLMIRFFRG